ncbi:MAG: tyrosine-type recombinase/integrase [Candidatus Nitrosocosmicus sp.]|nr:site-specific integrase [Candidatus Nitrosocosmicus sp.]
MSIEEKYKVHSKYNSNSNNSSTYSSELNQTQINLSNNPEDIIATKRKIEILTNHLKPHITKILNEVLQNNPINAKVICDYIIAEQNEINIKESTKETKIKKITHLSKYFHHQKTFYDMTKEDILDYLNNLRKSSAVDPNHKSIGTWNARQMLFLKFFRWLYNQSEPDVRRRFTPDCMKGIKQLPRKEISPYKPEDMWTPEENAVFLKYCPFPRDRCYHAMATDTSARPHELLNLRVKDIKFKISSEGIQYAEVTVNGKTGSRTLPLIDSIPYLKEWLLAHPYGDRQDSWLFISLSDKNLISNKNEKNSTKSIAMSQLSVNGLLKRYKIQHNNLFQKLLKDKDVPEADKSLIRNILTKPLNLYVLRHSSLTQASKIVKEHILRSHAGWTLSSKMPQRYIHYFGNESVRSILKAKGVIKENEDFAQNILKPKQCPNCNESNKQDSKVCIKCKMILSYDLYSEVRNEDKQKIDILETDIKSLKEGMTQLFLLIQQNPLLAHVKPEALSRN